MSESVNHTECEHNCNHSVFTGPVRITAANPDNENVALHLPASVESTIEIENEDGTTTNVIASGIKFLGNTDVFRIRYVSTGDTGGSSYGEIATADNGCEPIYVRQYSTFNKNPYGYMEHSLTLLDIDGTTSVPKALYIYDSATGKHIDVSATLKALAANKIVYKEG